MAVLPEYFNLLGPQAAMLEGAETIPGPTTDRMGALARDLRMGILCGSIPERSEIKGKIRNTSVFLSPEGEILSRYSKIHLDELRRIRKESPILTHRQAWILDELARG